jgi:hypothetical protein
MLLDVIRALENAGARAKSSRTSNGAAGRHVRLTVELDDKVVHLAVEERRHAPFPSEVAKISGVSARRRGQPQPILVAPFVSPGLGSALIEAGWSWADSAGNFDIKAPGLRLRQRLVLHRPPPGRRALPSGANSINIIRWLITKAPLNERLQPSELVTIGRVSQPWVSKLLQGLTRQELIKREGRSYRLEAVEPLLDAFLGEYRGPGGSERCTYSLDAPNDFAAKATVALGRLVPKGSFAISADVGPDLVSSWRKPTHTVVYLRDSVALDDLGLVEAKGRGDANVLLRLPDDTSIFSLLASRSSGAGAIPTVDLPQMMWDLLDLGGEDREEAAGKLREWFLQHR